MKIYETKTWKGRKNSYSWNEYHLKNNVIEKFKCTMSKFFDGKENTWSKTERKVDSWKIGTDHMPVWLDALVQKLIKEDK